MKLVVMCELYVYLNLSIADMRMKLSGLNAHRNKHHFVDFKSCPNCTADWEDKIHFFLSCTNYAALRQDLLEKFKQFNTCY